MVAEKAAKKAIGAENVFQRTFISHLLKDKRDPKRIAGAIGGVRVRRGGVFRGKPWHRSLR